MIIQFKPVLRSQSLVTGPRCLSVFEAQEGRCFYCNTGMHMRSRYGANRHISVKSCFGPSAPLATKDHLFPKSHGFSLRGNTVYACESCNRKKGNKYPTLEQIKRATLLWAKALEITPFMNYIKPVGIVKSVNGKAVFKMVYKQAA